MFNNNTNLKRISYIFLILLFVFTLASCSKNDNCIHCNTEHKVAGYYSSVLFTREIKYENAKFNSNKYDFNVELVNNYDELEKYMELHTKASCEDYFCESLFVFNAVIGVWNVQQYVCEFVFKSMKLSGNTLTFDVGSLSSAGTGFQSSLYFIVIPRLEIPLGFNPNNDYDVIYV